jgi:hypothetical protein
LFGTVVGATGGKVLGKSSVVGRNSWNFDDESMPEGTVGAGWAGNESDESGLTFRWCAALRCTLKLWVASDFVSKDSAMLLCARMWAHRYPKAPAPQRVRLVVNNQSIEEHTMGETIATETFRIPAGTLRRGPNHVALEFAYVKSPKEVGTSDDDRSLAAALDWIELDPVR